jgi:hypothetical protein
MKKDRWHNFKVLPRHLLEKTTKYLIQDSECLNRDLLTEYTGNFLILCKVNP